MYMASVNRYEAMKYVRCGKSGLKLPQISLGLWHNFGGVDTLENARSILHTAFDLGINHFDLANNYGPPPGSAEENFGKLLKQDFLPYRDELIISTKAGYHMWPGPYGEWGSKKYMMASLDQSLKRMGLDYVDIFYSHRPDPETPMWETMDALASAVRQGKALYVGISSYNPEQTAMAYDILDSMGVKCLIHQPSYSMFNRGIENGLLDVLKEKGMGCIVFSPLAQGMLTGKYLQGIPENSRAGKTTGFLKREQVTKGTIQKVILLDEIAKSRGQSIAQMALSWVLRGGRVHSAIIGASSPEQVIENVAAINNTEFTGQELSCIENILGS